MKHDGIVVTLISLHVLFSLLFLTLRCTAAEGTLVKFNHFQYLKSTASNSAYSKISCIEHFVEEKKIQHFNLCLFFLW